MARVKHAGKRANGNANAPPESRSMSQSPRPAHKPSKAIKKTDAKSIKQQNEVRKAKQKGATKPLPTNADANGHRRWKHGKKNGRTKDGIKQAEDSAQDDGRVTKEDLNALERALLQGVDDYDFDGMPQEDEPGRDVGSDAEGDMDMPEPAPEPSKKAKSISTPRPSSSSSKVTRDVLHAWQKEPAQHIEDLLSIYAVAVLERADDHAVKLNNAGDLEEFLAGKQVPVVKPGVAFKALCNNSDFVRHLKDRDVSVYLDIAIAVLQLEPCEGGYPSAEAEDLEANVAQLKICQNLRMVPAQIVVKRGYAKPVIEAVLHLWCNSTSEAVRSLCAEIMVATTKASAVGLKKQNITDVNKDLPINRKFQFLDTMYRQVYVYFLKSCRKVSARSLKWIHFLIQTGAEVYNVATASRAAWLVYQHAFGYIRAFAIQLRAALKEPQKLDVQINWSVVYGLRFWCHVLAQREELFKSPLKNLIFPIVQITLGYLSRVRSKVLIPFRMQLLENLMPLCSKQHVYIPLFKPIMDLIHSKDAYAFGRRALTYGAGGGEFRFKLRLKEQHLTDGIIADQIVEGVHDLWCKWFASEAYGVAFPELVTVPIQRVSFHQWWTCHLCRSVQILMTFSYVAPRASKSDA